VARIELAGGFYEDSALQFDAQRSINMYLERSQSGSSKSLAKLKYTSGFSPFGWCLRSSSNSFTPVNFLSLYTASNGKVYGITQNVAGSVRTSLHEVREDGNNIGSSLGGIVSPLGSAPQPEDVQMSDNGVVLIMVAGDQSAFYNFNTTTFTLVTDPDYPAFVSDVIYKDTYFLILDTENGRFYITDSYASDPTNFINALDFGVVESNPDEAIGFGSVGNEVAIFGSTTIEFFYNSGDVDFPFARNNGVTQEIGTLSRRTIDKVNNILFFLGANREGFAVVYAMNGYRPERVSTHPIEDKIRESTDIAGAFAYCYQEQGNSFYVMNFPGLTTTLVYHVNSGLWHERGIKDYDDNLVRLPGEVHTFGYGKNIVGGVVQTKRFPPEPPLDDEYCALFYYDKDSYTANMVNEVAPPDEGNNTLYRQRTMPHISNENKYIQYNYIELDIQKGVGNVDDTDPEITLNISRDGGMTYGPNKIMKMGQQNQFRGRCRKDMLGMARDAVFSFYSEAPVQHEWFSCYLDFEVMGE
jgi:hypothetical protein